VVEELITACYMDIDDDDDNDNDDGAAQLNTKLLVTEQNSKCQKIRW